METLSATSDPPEGDDGVLGTGSGRAEAGTHGRHIRAIGLS
jgi:hypothetical protein